MDALIYEDTPLADYFEGEAVPYDIQREPTPPHSVFAPRGLPSFKEKIQRLQRTAISISPPSSEHIIERFRYAVVASQLLSDSGAPNVAAVERESSEAAITTRGVLTTAVLSFLAAWAIHWLRSRKRSIRSTSWLEAGACAVFILVLAVAATYLIRRSYTRHIQRSAITSLSNFTIDSHKFDGVVSGAMRFVQEVEIVARGYELSYPLPPISRIEDKNTLRRCRRLRSELTTTLSSLTAAYVESHNTMQSLISWADMQRYHDIYEVSLAEYSDAIHLANEVSEDVKDSLKDLRLAVRSYTIARRIFLCDLLALRSTSGWYKLHQWRVVLRVLCELAEETRFRQEILSTCLREEECGSGGEERQARRHSSTPSLDPHETLTDPHRIKAQLRRFDEIAASARALNARIHILKEEISGLTTSRTDDAVIADSLRKHYDSIGADIRSLQLDWDRGRNTMMLLTFDSNNRSSHASSGPRTPLSPSPSFGGLPIIDGGPADALRLLNGGGDDRSASSRSSDAILLDEEVFEAVAKPRSKRMSVGVGFSREEKIAKLQEDRRKRATLQEQAETTTNMLRELQMVIKHRPSPSHGGGAMRSPYRQVSAS